MIRDFAAAAGTQPVIAHAFSGLGAMRVHQEIAAAPAKYANHEHVVLIMMHEGLKMSDLSGFEGWKLIIDEIPNVWDSASVRTPSLYHQLEACYRLETPKGKTKKEKPKEETKIGWSKVVMLPDAPSVADLIKDDTMAPWALFHRRVKSRQGVFASLKKWDDSVDGEEWQWYSIWNPAELAAFDDVWIVGNCFSQTVTYKLLKHFYGDDIDFVPFSVGGGVTFARRRLTIRYFTDSHVAATGLFAIPEGHDCVRRWADWIKANTPDQKHYWTANGAQMKTFFYSLPGQWCSPKIAGSNAFRDYHLCSILYTAKYNPTKDAALTKFGITKADILRSREYEDLIQIAFRSSLRVPESTAPVEVRVYDMQQAEFLRTYLLGAGFDLDVDLVYTDIGINHVVRGKGGHPDPTKGLSEIEVPQFVENKKKTRAQKAREGRAVKRAELIAAGLYKSVGRPRKDAR
jgi:hypothetical protein